MSIKIQLLRFVLVALLCGAGSVFATEGGSVNKLPKLLELGSKKCVPCREMAPILEKMSKDFAGYFTVEFVDVWLKENIEVGKKYNLEGIPTQIFLDADGKELGRNIGFIPEEEILKKWKLWGYDFQAMKEKKSVNP